MIDENKVREMQVALNGAIGAIQSILADMGEDAPDESSVAAELFVNMSYDWPPAVVAEVARREFGFVPGGARQDVADAFATLTEGW